MLTVRLPEALEKQLVEHAEKTGRSKGDIAREGILRVLSGAEKSHKGYQGPDPLKNQVPCKESSKAVLDDLTLRGDEVAAPAASFACPRCKKPLGSPAAVCGMHGRKAVPV